jgi:hypothetical protein
MSEEASVPPSASESTLGDGVDSRYVAFCDILGFSNRILADFDKTLEVYKDFGQTMSEFPATEVQATMYSDAILITAASLDKVLVAVQSLCFLALAHNLMIRGSITKGRYWEQRQGNHFLVASDALVRAVKLEKTVGVPAVVIADDVEIPDNYWLTRFVSGTFRTPLLHFRDRNIVNPFNVFWFRSAAFRASQLMAESPEHKDKYLWFLALHKAVEDGQELIPPDILTRFLREGVLKRRNTEPQGEQPPS